MKKHELRTYTGKVINPLNVDSEDIDINDIAHALSNICRYNGHCKYFYSVAQHSILLTQYILCSKLNDKLNKAKYALLHDASEAYLCDIPDPLKSLESFSFYRSAEYDLQSKIYYKFGLYGLMPDDVKKLDFHIRVDETRSLFENYKYSDIKPLGIEIRKMSSSEAKNNFLLYYNNIFGGKI